MYPSFRVNDNQIQFGPFLLDRMKGTVEMLPWPPFFDLYQLWRWKPGSFVPIPDGGIWAVQDRKSGDYRVIRLDKTGNLVEAITLSKSDVGEFDYWPFIASGEWIKAGDLLLRVRNVRGLEKRKPYWSTLPPKLRYPFEHFRRLYLCPDGSILLADGRAIDPDGDMRQVFNPDAIWQVISARYNGRIFPKGLFPVLDGDTIWILAHGAQSKLEDLLVVARLHPHDGLMEWKSEQVVKTDGLNFFPLSNGAWVAEVYPQHRRHSSIFTPVWWVHPPGADSFEVIDIWSVLMGKGIQWERTLYFGGSGDGDIVALVNGLKDDSRLLIAWFGKTHPGDVFLLAEEDATTDGEEPFFPDNFLWDVLRDPHGRGIAIVHKPPSVQILASKYLTFRELAKRISEGDETVSLLGIERVFSKDGLFLLFIIAYHNKKRSYCSLLVSGRIQDSNLEVVSRLVLDADVLTNIEVDDSGDQTIFIVRYLKAAWKIVLWPDGNIAAFVAA